MRIPGLVQEVNEHVEHCGISFGKNDPLLCCALPERREVVEKLLADTESLYVGLGAMLQDDCLVGEMRTILLLVNRGRGLKQAYRGLGGFVVTETSGAELCVTLEVGDGVETSFNFLSRRRCVGFLVRLSS